MAATPVTLGLAPRRPLAELERKLRLRAERGIEFYRHVVRDGPHAECPVCGYVGPFSPVREKPGAWCPACDSRPRHRLLRLWMDRHLGLAPGTRMLHWAPEAAVAALLRPHLAEYVTADPVNPADLAITMEATGLPDARFDLVMANHVLEHVADESGALAELFRILAPGGRAILTVPLVEGWDATHEDPAIATAEARRLHYLDATHRRLYGRDFSERLARAGFRVSAFAAVEPDVSRFALTRGERVFVAEKPA